MIQYGAFETNEEAKLLRCIDDMGDALGKEVRNAFNIDTRGGAMVRNEFNVQLSAMLESQVRKMRENNKLSFNL